MRHYFEQYTNYSITIQIKHIFAMTELDLIIYLIHTLQSYFINPLQLKKYWT